MWRGRPRPLAQWTMGEDARFTMAVCHENIAISGRQQRKNVEDRCAAGSKKGCPHLQNGVGESKLEDPPAIVE